MQFLNDTLTERPATRVRIRQLADRYLNGLTFAASTGATAKTFERFTGMTHDYLLNEWFGEDRKPNTADDTTSRMTTCNSFVGKYAHIIPPTKRKSANFMGFYYKLECKKAKISKAYYSQKEHPNLRPGYGDIVKFTRHHVAVSLGIHGGKWNRIESGQGGRRSGFDAIVFRKNKLYLPSEIEGWVNLAILFDYDELLRERAKLEKMWNDSPWETMLKAQRAEHRRR